MGKFELAPAIDVRLEPIKETFVHSPVPPYVQIVELPPLRPQAAWTLRAVRDPSYGLRGQAVGRKGFPVNLVEIARSLRLRRERSTVTATVNSRRQFSASSATHRPPTPLFRRTLGGRRCANSASWAPIRLRRPALVETLTSQPRFLGLLSATSFGRCRPYREVFDRPVEEPLLAEVSPDIRNARVPPPGVKLSRKSER
jgi:hypothetical protein